MEATMIGYVVLGTNNIARAPSTSLA